MRYQFKQFEFDTDSLILKQNGEDISIRHNEAKLLALLIEQSDKVHSKEEILSQVWQDKVVSEQAVFQNISHLRNLFGNDAIKTFSKRGYQWQLAVDCSEAQEQPATELDKPAAIEVTTNESAKVKQDSNFGYFVALAFMLFLLLNWQFDKKPEEVNQVGEIKVAYLPFADNTASNQNNSTNAIQFVKDNQYFDFIELKNVNLGKFKTSIELEYPSLAKQYPYVISGQLREYQDLVHLDFSLNAPNIEWSGQLSANTKEQVINLLAEHLNNPIVKVIVTSPLTPDNKQAALSLAHQQDEQDLIILNQLIDAYIKINELDKAMVLADKLIALAESKQDMQQLGNALLHQSTILTQKELHELSSHKLGRAIVAFEQINDVKRQADALNAQSWLDHKNKDYPAIKASLLKSAELALTAKDIPRELHALTYLSVMAHKHHQHDDKYLYLQQAENKMKAYQLPIYHFAKVPFHYAIYADNPMDKEPHLKQVLVYTELTPNHWVAQSSREQLMEFYIEQGRLKDAEQLVTNLIDENASNLYIKTLLAKAQQDQTKFVQLAQTTFEQAQLSGDNRVSLDTALLLCENPNTQVNYDFYSQYISQHATVYWRRANKDKLTALNL